MTPTVQKVLMMIAGNLLGALVIDLQGFQAAREAARESGKAIPQFDFVTFGIRMLIAAASGALVGGGWGAVSDAS